MLLDDRDEVVAFARTSNRPVVDSMETDYMALLNSNSYEKGSWVLHMLRNELGDSVFKKSIREYYRLYGNSIAGTEDLKNVFEKVSGNDLDDFFRQWLYEPGIPRIRVTWKYDASSKKINITIEQQQSEIFSFPLEIGVGNDQKNRRLQVTKKIETFSLPLEAKPSGLVLDPNVVLLFEGKVY
jgi:aminopeptidase N